MKIVIINYGAGNIQSIKFAIQRLGYEAVLSDNSEVIRAADKVIFPGVGEASSAMEKLKASKLNKLIPMLYAGGGLEYFQNGFQSTLIDLKRKLHYISVPLYLKVKFGPVYATAGTALNFKLAEKNILAGASVDPLSEKSDVFDLPLQAGIGVKILMFSIEARYNWGMLDVNNGVKNQYFQLGLAVFF